MTLHQFETALGLCLLTLAGAGVVWVGIVYRQFARGTRR